MSSHHSHERRSSDGSMTTTRHLKDLARRYLAHLERKLTYKPAAVVELWPQVIAPQFIAMTKADRFEEGVLHVKVSNSSLLSLLHSPLEKKRLTEALQIKIPDVEIKDICFRIGSL